MDDPNKKDTKEQIDQNVEQEKKVLNSSFKEFFEAFKSFMTQLLDIREGTDIPETIDKIKEGIVVRSHTAWILIFSIVIASIGLNVSSTAVVIGAMLISPLMGPILGIGLPSFDITTLTIFCKGSSSTLFANDGCVIFNIGRFFLYKFKIYRIIFNKLLQFDFLFD